jgi:intein/homing endonuclease
MAAKVNEVITGVYNHRGNSIIYGDSVTGDTKILTSNGEMTISELFDRCLEHCVINDKEYGLQSLEKVLGFNSYEDESVIATPAYVMRHKTKKKIYLITLENGKSVKVTEDHSLMVDRDGFLLEVKPTEILENDLCVCVKR